MKKRYFILGIFLIIIDQLTKFLIINKNITLIPNFINFTYTENTGGAFGIGNKIIITIISLIIIIGIIIFLIYQKDKIKNYYPFILIISGSFGNLIDRLFRGYVIDFIDINLFNYPNFNIADICIVIGVFLLIIILIKDIIKNK